MGFHWTVLVGRERMSGMRMATAVPTKGSTGKFALDKCLEYIDENGDREGTIIVKTDQESSAKFLVKEVVERRKEGKTLVEESPV